MDDWSNLTLTAHCLSRPAGSGATLLKSHPSRDFCSTTSRGSLSCAARRPYWGNRFWCRTQDRVRQDARRMARPSCMQQSRRTVGRPLGASQAHASRELDPARQSHGGISKDAPWASMGPPHGPGMMGPPMGLRVLRGSSWLSRG